MKSYKQFKLSTQADNIPAKARSRNSSSNQGYFEILRWLNSGEKQYGHWNGNSEDPAPHSAKCRHSFAALYWRHSSAAVAELWVKSQQVKENGRWRVTDGA